MTARRISKLPLAAVLLVLVVGASLRLPGIRQPLWDAFSWRESSTAMMADNFLERSWNIFYPEVSWTGPGPSYQGREFQVVSYIAAGLNKLRGWRDWHGRLVAVFFGFWCLVAFYLLSNEVLGNGRAWAPPLVLALVPGSAFIDRSFLPEPAMLALTTTGLWLFLVHLRTDRLCFLLLAGLSTSLGILAKLPGISVLGVMGWLCWTELRHNAPSRRRWIVLAIVLALILLPVLLYYRWTVSLGSSYPPYHVAGHGYFLQDPVGFFRNGFYLPQLAGHHLPWLIGFPVLLLAAIGIFSRSDDERERRAARLFGAWLVSVAALFLFSAEEMTVNPWNLATFYLPVAGFAGLGWLRLARLGGGVRGLALNAMIGAVLLFASVGILKMMKAPVAYASWRLGERLRELSTPDELVVTAAAEIGNPIAIYYSRRRGWVYPPGGLCPPGGPTADHRWGLLEDDARAIPRLEALRASGASWVGFARSAKDQSGRLLVNHHRGLLAYLRTVAVFVEETDDWLIYKLPPGGSAAARSECVSTRFGRPGAAPLP